NGWGHPALVGPGDGGDDPRLAHVEDAELAGFGLQKDEVAPAPADRHIIERRAQRHLRHRFVQGRRRHGQQRRHLRQLPPPRARPAAAAAGGASPGWTTRKVCSNSRPAASRTETVTSVVFAGQSAGTSQLSTPSLSRIPSGAFCSAYCAAPSATLTRIG